MVELESKENIKYLSKQINMVFEKYFGKEIDAVFEILTGATAIYEELTEEILIATLESVIKNKIYFHFTSEEILNWPMLENKEALQAFFDDTNVRFKLKVNLQQESYQVSEMKLLKIAAANVDVHQIEDALTDLIKIDFLKFEYAYKKCLVIIKSQEFKENVAKGYQQIKRVTEQVDEITENLMQKFALKKVYFETLLRIDESIQLPEMKSVGRILNASQLTEKQKRDLLIKERLSKIVQVIEFPYENQKYISLVKDKDIEEFLSLAKVSVQVVINLLENSWEIGHAYIDWAKLTQGDGWDNKYYVAKELGLKMKEKENEHGETIYYVDYDQFTDATCEWIKANLVLRQEKLKEDVMKKVELFQLKSKEIIK